VAGCTTTPSSTTKCSTLGFPTTTRHRSTFSFKSSSPWTTGSAPRPSTLPSSTASAARVRFWLHSSPHVGSSDGFCRDVVLCVVRCSGGACALASFPFSPSLSGRPHGHGDQLLPHLHGLLCRSARGPAPFCLHAFHEGTRRHADLTETVRLTPSSCPLPPRRASSSKYFSRHTFLRTDVVALRDSISYVTYFQNILRNTVRPHPKVLRIRRVGTLAPAPARRCLLVTSCNYSR